MFDQFLQISLASLSGGSLTFLLLFLINKTINQKAAHPFEWIIYVFGTGFCVGVLYFNYGMSLYTLSGAIFLIALFLAGGIDAKHGIIPDIVNYPAIPICFALSPWLLSQSYFASFLGLLTGSGFLWLLNLFFRCFKGKEGLGKGDIKLCAFMGAALGPLGVITAIMLASISGLLFFSVSLLRRTKNLKTAVPFGPFLALGGLLTFFLNDFLNTWIWGLYSY